MKLVLNKDQNVYFTSDTHFNHPNICRGTTNWKDADNVTRDFSTLEDMNNMLVSNINNNVDENDILFHLGDWSFGGFESIEMFRSQIKCKNIYLILGNHDHHIANNKNKVQNLFKMVTNYSKIQITIPSVKEKNMVDKFKFVLCHFPITSWDGMNEGIIHLHGHIHLPKHLRVGNGRSLDVGVDGNDLLPLSLDTVVELLKNQPIKHLVLPKDHHEKQIN
jgi:calcineurin-like phosphoesterase family protein